MELVEGPTLADRIADGALPLKEALPIAEQIAEALEAAHEQGIIHRDLKPANVKVRPDGTVKVLDFGLAKAMDTASPISRDGSQPPSITTPAMTHAGVILGTAAYMSPEQARGKPVDKRTDVWAFGCGWYEMVTGKRVFNGDETTDVLAAVLRQDIDWTMLPEPTPTRLRWVVQRCLERDPKRRLRDIGDVRLLLEALAEEPPERASSQAPPVRKWSKTTVAMAAGALVAGLLTGWVVAHRLGTPVHPIARVVRFSIEPPPDVTEISNVALAADGSLVVYEGISNEHRLYVRRLMEGESRLLQGTEGARWPFLSPDNRWVGFFRNGKLQKVSLSGGDILTLSESKGGPGAAWGHDCRILVASSWTGDRNLESVPDEGGAPTVVTPTRQEARERGYWWPAFLPDGRHALVTVFRAGAGLNDNRVAVLDLETGQSQTLFAGARAFWLNSGHILFFHAGRYQVVPFDAVTRRVIGEAFPVLDDALQLDPTGDWPQPVAAAANGTIAYVPGRYVPDSRLAWVLPDGSVESLPWPARPYISVALSPDEERIAVSSLEGGTLRLRILDLRRQGEQVLDLDGMNWGAAWHPGENRLAFSSIRKGDIDAYMKDLDTDCPEQAVLDGSEDSSVVAWTREGQLVTRSSD